MNSTRLCSRFGAFLLMAVGAWALCPLAVRADDIDDANAAYDSGDYAHALQLYLPLAENGDEWAQERAGFLYEAGRGTLKDYAQASHWYRKAADQGSPYAQTGLGIFYQLGRGVPEDDAAALSWFRKAASQGYPKGCFYLGNAFEFGHGTPTDYIEAYRWYALAAAKGHAEASDGMRRLEREKMTREQVAEAQRRAGSPSSAALKSADASPARPSGGVSKEEMQAMMEAAAKKAVATQAPAQAPAVTKEDMQAMADEAAKKAAAAQKPAESPAPKEKRSDVDKPSYSAPENPDNFALVVGVEKYSDLPEAQYAERDARAVREHLAALGYPERNIILLTGRQASRAGLVKNLETRLPGIVNGNSTVFFYYSGHGAPDPKTGQAYLVPEDGDPEFLEDTAYPVKRLYQKLNALKAKRVIVALDSCFSGAGGRSVLAKGTRPLVTKIDLGSVGAGKVVSLSASAGDQISGVSDEQGHGLFTYFFLRGLNGAAQDESGGVTVKSLYDYLSPKVQDAARRSNRDQTPQLASPPESGKIKLR